MEGDCAHQRFEDQLEREPCARKTRRIAGCRASGENNRSRHEQMINDAGGFPQQEQALTRFMSVGKFT